MRFLFFIILFLASQISFAQISGDCSAMAEKYLIRGDMNSVFGGDRLWSLERMNRDYKADMDSTCLQEIRKTSLDDAKEYWLGYIATKYSCASETALEMPTEKPDGCSEKKWNQIKENNDYINAIESGKLGSSSAKRKNKQICNTQPTTASIKDLATHINEQKPDPCQKYGYDQQHLKNAKPTDEDLGYLKSCLVGMGKGFTDLKSTFTESFKALAKMIKDPSYRAAVMSTIADLSSALVREPQKTLNAMYTSFVSELREHNSEFMCLNPKGTVMEICNQLANKGLALLTGGIGLKVIRMAVQQLKFGKAATPNEKTLKLAVVKNNQLLIGKEKPVLNTIKVEGPKLLEDKTKGQKLLEDKTNPQQKTKTQEPKKQSRNNFDPVKDQDEINKIKSIKKMSGDSVSVEDFKNKFGIKPNATNAEVKTAVRRLLSKYASDKNLDYKEETKEIQQMLNKLSEQLRNK